MNTNQSPAQAGSKVPVRLATVLAALLAVNTAVQVWTMAEHSVTPAHGQSRSGNEPPPFPNQNETQRRVETQAIETNARLARIEAKLDKPLSVKITEMPPVVVSNISAVREASKDSSKEAGQP
jgi:hypothetical protein